MARDFDGSNQEIDWGDNIAYEAATLTLFSWVNMNALTADGTIISKGAVGGSTYFLFFDNTGSQSGRTDIYNIFIGDGTDAGRVEGATNSAQSGVWQSVLAITKQDTTNGIELWIDGSEDANSPANTTNVNDYGGGTASLKCGEDSNNLRDLNGKLAFQAIWDIELNDTQKQALSRGINPLFISGTKPVYFGPIYGNDSPEPKWGSITGSGTVTGATKAATNPPVQLLSRYL